ncbi:WG repeat-containing protein [Spirosoma rhododendri]|uniref:WG repeat-containing protein n=1 Tax=Spirosoma rhododendri TaxID=2728024 RepID=UPI0020C373FF|nr:WG repeat-containing protein [Spirosoma rhododendri]
MTPQNPTVDESATARIDTIPAPATETTTTAEAVQEKPATETEPVAEQATDTKTAGADNTPVTSGDARQGRYEEAFGDSRFDKVELGEDDRGWRRARKNGRWGYIDPENNWVIQPRFEAITPFRNDVASAFLDGQMLKIDRSGEPVRP